MFDWWTPGEAVVKALTSLSDSALKWVQWRENTRDQRLAQRDRERRVEAARETLDSMLRNPKWRFRTIERLARAIDDTSPDYAVTKELLKSIGARRNTGEVDSWTVEKHWVDDGSGGHVLKPGLAPSDI
jgi:hypothetical protein